MSKAETTIVKYSIRPKNKPPRGTVIKRYCSEDEAKHVMKTGKYKFNVWPDHDSFNYDVVLDAKVVKTTTTVVKEIFCA